MQARHAHPPSYTTSSSQQPCSPTVTAPSGPPRRRHLPPAAACMSARASAAPASHAEAAVSKARSSTSSSKRGVLLGGVAAASILLLPSAPLLPPAHAAIVDEEVAERCFEQASRCVVSIASARGSGEQLGTGSGIVWSAQGHIITNFHVVSAIDKASDLLTVVAWSPADGKTHSMYARVVGSDTQNDLAVIKAEGWELQPAVYGISKQLQVGQSVFACGYPYGLPASLSVGVVSGLNRSIPSPVGTRIYGAIQTDASINGGNSGGPLLDSAGHVVGICTATYSRAPSAGGSAGRGSGVNFAIPIDKVVATVPNLISSGNAGGKRI